MSGSGNAGYSRIYKKTSRILPCRPGENNLPTERPLRTMRCFNARLGIQRIIGRPGLRNAIHAMTTAGGDAAGLNKDHPVPGPWRRNDRPPYASCWQQHCADMPSRCASGRFSSRAVRVQLKQSPAEAIHTACLPASRSPGRPHRLHRLHSRRRCGKFLRLSCCRTARGGMHLIWRCIAHRSAYRFILCEVLWDTVFLRSDC